MKDFEALSRKHFDRQAAEYDQGHDLYRHWKERNSLRESEDAAL